MVPVGNVVVTGAGHGIGAALAERFARDGNCVALLDRDSAAAEAVAKRLERHGARTLALPCDVVSDPECRDAIARVIDRWGGIDILVNNAGITHVGLIRDTDVDVIRRVMEINFCR